MFAIDKRKRARLICIEYMGERDTSKCGDCHCIRILRLSADVYTSQKRVVEQSFCTRFISFTYVLSLFRALLISLVHIQLMSERRKF